MSFSQHRARYLALFLVGLALLILVLWFVWGRSPFPSATPTDTPSSAAPLSLRVLTHSSFDVDKALLSQFEVQHAVKLELMTAGDAGEMLNKLILTRQAPIADVVYGLDNLSAHKAQQEGVLSPYRGAAAVHYELGDALSAIDYGAVTINADVAALQARGLTMPKRLEDFLQPAYRNTLVVQHPASSSPGQAFLVATVLHFGEDKAWEFWRGLKANGLKVTNGWTEAYQKEFSHNGGAYPFVVSYASSPAAEVFYGQGKYTATTAPTQSLDLAGGVFLQVEGAALVHQTEDSARTQARQDKGKAFIDFLQSAEVQKDLQTRMWMLPAVKSAAPEAALATVRIPEEATLHAQLDSATVQGWVKTWTRLMRP